MRRDSPVSPISSDQPAMYQQLRSHLPIGPLPIGHIIPCSRNIPLYPQAPGLLNCLGGSETMTTLWMAPYTCARVTAIALEEAGVEFDTRLVRFMRGEHKSAEFKTRNPKGKVPALEIDGNVLTENVAILSYLAERLPA